jgi:hypothetical protein
MTNGREEEMVENRKRIWERGMRNKANDIDKR